MEAMENAVASSAERAIPGVPIDAFGNQCDCSCYNQGYNQVASTSFYDSRVNIRQIAFGDALRFLGDDQSKVADLGTVLEIAKRLETFYLEGKTLADTVK